MKSSKSQLALRCPKDRPHYLAKQIIQEHSASKQKQLKSSATNNTLLNSQSRPLLTINSNTNNNSNPPLPQSHFTHRLCICLLSKVLPRPTATTEYHKHSTSKAKESRTILIDHSKSSYYNESEDVQESKKKSKQLDNMNFLENCLRNEIQKLEIKNDINSKASSMSRVYEQSVVNYEQLIHNIEMYRSEVQMRQQNIAMLREQIAMTRCDYEAQYLQKTELLLLKQDYQAILGCYAEQFEQENQLIDRQFQVERQIALNNQRKQEFVSKIEALEAKQHQLYEQYSTSRTNILDQKANLLRIQLLQVQQKLNQQAKKIMGSKVCLVRELVCSFYTTTTAVNEGSSSDKTMSEGMEMWICKHQLVSTFEEYIYRKQSVLINDRNLDKTLQQYIGTLKRIEAIYRRTKNNIHEDSLKQCIGEEEQLMREYNMCCGEAKRLEDEQQELRRSLEELLVEERNLFMHSKHQSSTNNNRSSERQEIKARLQGFTEQQKNRLDTIIYTKKRLEELDKTIIKKLKEKPDLTVIKKLEGKLAVEMREHENCKKQFTVLEKTRVEREKEFELAKVATSAAAIQENKEALQILKSKINKLQEKKMQLASQLTSPKMVISRVTNHPHNHQEFFSKKPAVPPIVTTESRYNDYYNEATPRMKKSMTQYASTSGRTIASNSKIVLQQANYYNYIDGKSIPESVTHKRQASNSEFKSSKHNNNNTSNSKKYHPLDDTIKKLKKLKLSLSSKHL